MDTNHHGKIAYLIFLCSLSGIAVLLRTIASFLHLSPLGYYTGKLALAAGWTVLLGMLLLLTFAITHRRDVAPGAAFNGPLTYAPAAPLAVTLLFIGASLMLRKAEGTLEKIAFPALGILAALGAFYFFFAVFFEKNLCDLRAIFGAILSLYLILYAGYLYFDTALPINATTKICDQMAYVAAAIFFLLETRLSLGRVRWPLYTAGGLAASLLTAYSAIPSLLVYIFDGRMITNCLEDLLVLVMLTAYIFCRTVLFLIMRPQVPTALMAELQSAAHLRTEEVLANGPLPFEPEAAEKKEEADIEAEEAGEALTPEEAGEAAEETEDTEETAADTDEKVQPEVTEEVADADAVSEEEEK